MRIFKIIIKYWCRKNMKNQAKYLTIVMLVVCNQIKLYNISMDEILQKVRVEHSILFCMREWEFIFRKCKFCTCANTIRSSWHGPTVVELQNETCVLLLLFSSILLIYSNFVLCDAAEHAELEKSFTDAASASLWLIFIPSSFIYISFSPRNADDDFSRAPIIQGSYVFETRAKSSLNNSQREM